MRRPRKQGANFAPISTPPQLWPPLAIIVLMWVI